MKKWTSKLMVSLVMGILGLALPFQINAAGTENQSIPAKIDRVLEEKQVEIMDSKQLYQKLEVEITEVKIKAKK